MLLNMAVKIAAGSMFMLTMRFGFLRERSEFDAVDLLDRWLGLSLETSKARKLATLALR